MKSEITKKSCFYLRVLYTAISSLQIMLQFSKAKEAILADYKKEENKSITIRVCTNVKRAGMEGIVLHCTEIGLIIIRFFSTLKISKPVSTKKPKNIVTHLGFSCLHISHFGLCCPPMSHAPILHQFLSLINRA